MLPPGQVTHFVSLEAPKRCLRCQQSLKGKAVAPLVSQVVEVPPVKPEVTQYTRHGRECECGAINFADMPDDVSGSTFGPRLTAMVSLLSGKYRLSKRLVQSALSDCLGVRLSLGAVSNRDMEVSAALAAPVEEAQEIVHAADWAHADETGWTEGILGGRKKRAWLWVAVTSWVTLFRIATSRSGEAAKDLLGRHFTGRLVTDRYSAYQWVALRLRQLCWSHLTRDWQAFIDRGHESARIGRQLMWCRHKMFKWWHRVRDGTKSRSEFQRQMKPLQREVGRLLCEAAVCPHAKTRGTAREILKLESAMWTFVETENLQPTNNAAEQAIRFGAIYRKTSFGTHSPEGSRFVERMLTVVATLRQQDRNVLEYLTTAVVAHRRGQPPPSLVPDVLRPQFASAA